VVKCRNPFALRGWWSWGGKLEKRGKALNLANFNFSEFGENIPKGTKDFKPEF